MGQIYGKVQYYPDGTGSTVIYKNPIDSWETAKPNKKQNKLFLDDLDDSASDSEENVFRSVRRSKRVIRDYIKCNDFTHFVTLTFKPKFKDNDERFTKLQNWLKYMRKKHGKFDYVLVPELHKNGQIHLHGVMDLSKFDLIKAENKAVLIKHKGQQVYNLKDWGNTGYSTATEIRDKNKVAGYVTKYISKNFHDTVKKHKKKYWCSKGLKTPVETPLEIIPELDGKPDFENDFVRIYNF